MVEAPRARGPRPILVPPAPIRPRAGPLLSKGVTCVTTPTPTSTDQGRPESYADVVRHLAARASKTNKGAPAYTRWVNRPLGRRAAAAAYLRSMTPNQLTAINAV